MKTRCKTIFAAVLLCASSVLFASCGVKVTEDEVAVEFRENFSHSMSSLTWFFDDFAREDFDGDFYVLERLYFYNANEWDELHDNKDDVFHFPITDVEGNIRAVFSVVETSGVTSAVNISCAPFLDSLLKNGITRFVLIVDKYETLYAVADNVVYFYDTSRDDVPIRILSQEEAEPYLRAAARKGVRLTDLTVHSPYTDIARESYRIAERGTVS